MRKRLTGRVLRLVTSRIMPALLFVVTAVASLAQTFSTLVRFNGSDGAQPSGSLVQGLDGKLYGTAVSGGANGAGTVFRVTSAGELATLHSFCREAGCSDGSEPFAGLTLASDGQFYGTTVGGGTTGNGTVFKITPGGIVTTLHSFEGPDGAAPFAGLAQATDGSFYGTTNLGGAFGFGTIFKILPSGRLTNLHSFDGNDGQFLYAGLVEGSGGSFYGVTYQGGAFGLGTLFKISREGILTTLHNFGSSPADGAIPYGGLVRAADGNLYGTTLAGGNGSNCSSVGGCGTVFKVTQGGTLTILHIFNQTDGAQPHAALVQATDGNLYGTTLLGGLSCRNVGSCGTVFKITPGGKFERLHYFDYTDGAGSSAALFQATNGNLYGLTTAGGSNRCETGCGTIFRMNVGLGSFVETLPSSGQVGDKVIILGTNLTGTTRVHFNGTLAAFTLLSSSAITTKVPPGAKTGKIAVTTPRGVLESGVIFRVTP